MATLLNFFPPFVLVLPVRYKKSGYEKISGDPESAKKAAGENARQRCMAAGGSMRANDGEFQEKLVVPAGSPRKPSRGTRGGGCLYPLFSLKRLGSDLDFCVCEEIGAVA